MVEQAQRAPEQGVGLALVAQLQVALGAHVALRQHVRALVVAEEELGAVRRERAREKLRPVNEPSLSPPVGEPSASRNGQSSRAAPVTPVPAATSSACSSRASGTGSACER